MKSIVILYHSDCWDGFGGAWAAWKKFGKKAHYIGLKHGVNGTKLPNELKGKEIYIIDFSFSPNLTKKLVNVNKKVVILDHHISAKESVKVASEYVYEMNHSGATIAWKYFHPQKKTPRLLLHIEDMDIWKFKLPKTKEIYAYLHLQKYDFREFDKLVANLETPSFRKEFINKGGEILKYERKSIEKLVKNAELVKFVGRKVLALNSPILMSEIGHELSKKKPPLAIVWSERNGIISVSLRSNGKTDVSKIAKRYGGGGHKGAAGFAFRVGQEPPWKLIPGKK